MKLNVDTKSLKRENALTNNECIDDLDMEYLYDEITILMEFNISKHWYAEAHNFGWAKQFGCKYFTARNGRELLQQVLPKTDCTYYIWPFEQNGIAINNMHHDSPTGAEWYFIVEDKETHD